MLVPRRSTTGSSGRIRLHLRGDFRELRPVVDRRNDEDGVRLGSGQGPVEGDVGSVALENLLGIAKAVDEVVESTGKMELEKVASTISDVLAAVAATAPPHSA